MDAFQRLPDAGTMATILRAAADTAVRPAETPCGAAKR
jgi:hypothetical protein